MLCLEFDRTRRYAAHAWNCNISHEWMILSASSLSLAHLMFLIDRIG
jgi:hypothetical protein